MNKKIADFVDRTKNKQTGDSNSSDALSSSRVPYVRTIQNFRLVWLDSNIDDVNNNDCMITITKLRQVVNAVQTFTNADECIAFITNIEDEKIFMISSGKLGETTVPIVHDKPQLSTIYIFCGNKTRHECWTQQWPKVKGVYTDITPICEALEQAAQDCDQNSVSISFVKITEGASKQNLDQLNQSFMYTQILKEILLTIDFEPESFNDFLTYCREYFVDNSIELKNVDKIEKEYRNHQPIWWYTYNCFLYSMLNRALRTMEVDLIIKLGFFVRDLHQHIDYLHSAQYTGHRRSRNFTVYRGQGLSHIDFNQLMKAQGGLLSFNCFLSTSKNRNVSLAFARRSSVISHMMGILFVMTINASVSSTPFANIHDVSAYQSEEEILLSMHSIFRIGSMKQIDKNNDRIWQVELTLTSDKDPQLHDLTEHIRKETFSGHKGWFRLGMLLIKLGQFNKAEQVYEVLLKKSTKKDEKAHLYHMFGMIKNEQGKYEEAVEFYEKSIKINKKILSSSHLDLAASYSGIGFAYRNMKKKDYSRALSCYEDALLIYKMNFSPNHANLATCYNNIGFVYEGMKKYSTALTYYQKALEIYENTLPSNHPNLATSYNNIGGVHESLGNYSEALSCHEKVLEIYQNTLPPNHPDLACPYGQIGMVSSKIGDHSRAVEYCERALKILEHSLPSDHPEIQLYKANLESVKENL